MEPRFEPGFVIERVNPLGITYVVRRLNPKPGQLSLLKCHRNQLKPARREYEVQQDVQRQPEEVEPGRVSRAVRNLQVLARCSMGKEKNKGPSHQVERIQNIVERIPQYQGRKIGGNDLEKQTGKATIAKEPDRRNPARLEERHHIEVSRDPPEQGEPMEDQIQESENQLRQRRSVRPRRPPKYYHQDFAI